MQVKLGDKTSQLDLLLTDTWPDVFDRACECFNVDCKDYEMKMVYNTPGLKKVRGNHRAREEAGQQQQQFIRVV